MIGETLYLRDGNRRRYVDDAGNPAQTMNYRHTFIPIVVSSETARSWLVDKPGGVLKISKAALRISTARAPGLDAQVYTAQQMEDAIWLHANRSRIYRAVLDCRDAAVLRAVDALLTQ